MGTVGWGGQGQYEAIQNGAEVDMSYDNYLDLYSLRPRYFEIFFCRVQAPGFLGKWRKNKNVLKGPPWVLG